MIVELTVDSPHAAQHIKERRQKLNRLVVKTSAQSMLLSSSERLRVKGFTPVRRLYTPVENRGYLPLPRVV